MGGVGERERRWLVRLLLVLALGVLLGRLGPFDTFSELGSGERYAYWIGLTLLMWLQGVAILALVGGPLSGRWPRWLVAGMAALLAAIPTGFEVAWAEMFLRVDRDLGPVDLLAIIGDVALLSVPLLLLTHGWQPEHALPEAHAEGAGADLLAAMLPPQKRGPLIAIESEDHYVRLYTAAGNELVSMRFRDTLARAERDGLQVHRRWWVARNAVETVQRVGDGLQLTLKGGLKVPVSRSYAQQVKAAWVDRLN